MVFRVVFLSFYLNTKEKKIRVSHLCFSGIAEYRAIPPKDALSSRGEVVAGGIAAQAVWRVSCYMGVSLR